METPPAEDYRKYLDPRTLAKIAGLDLRARLVVEGYVSGKHRSPYHGFSVEFAEHRQYAPGDDVKHMDWKVFARTDKLYVKQYEEETNLTCLLAVDCSDSMNFKSDPAGLTKHEYATATAAAIAYLALHQQDAVGLATFDENITRFLRPSNNPVLWKTLIHEMEHNLGPKKTSMRTVLADLAERVHRRTLIVIVSDLLDDPSRIIQGLRKIRYKKHEIILLQILDPAELKFEFVGPVLFRGKEQTGKLFADAGGLRRRYLEEVERFLSTLRRSCTNLRIDYSVFDTSEPLDASLSTFLVNRSAHLK
jgi:uncharacterized protein (DUF58 family)